MEMALNSFVKVGPRAARLGVVTFLQKHIYRDSLRLSRRNCVFQSPTAGSSQASVDAKNQVMPALDSPSLYTTRSHTCGELRRSNVGETVCLKGWVQYNRQKFLIIRDAYGTTQVLIEDVEEGLRKLVDSLTLESVIEVRGEVLLRPKNQINPNMATGEIEIKVSHLKILGMAPGQLPLFIRDNKMPTEQVRMRYRYLYLRYPHMQKTLRLRSQVIHAMREFLIGKHFVDVETPTLFRKTPGGAQEFVVPTQNQGLYYSLVQSPQQFKQLLMVGGLDRYFQVARCYRDETVRYDRQPEFTQLDVELSFVDREGVISLIEELLEFCWPADLRRISVPFPRMTYFDAMCNYGSDKPDLRFDSKIHDITNLMKQKDSEMLNKNKRSVKFSARAIIFPKAAAVLKKQQLVELHKEAQSQSNVYTTQLSLVPIRNDLHSSSLHKIVSENEILKIEEDLKPSQGDLLITCLGPTDDVLKVLGLARVLTADALEASGFHVRKADHSFLWVVDFPLFEEDENGSLLSAHHPFTQPHPDDIHLLSAHPLKVRGLHYDLVLNGSEIGGGSIRISDAKLQESILRDMLHLDTSTFQHLLDALSIGCPPHGGIALGLDRLFSIICGVKSIREVIAFPKALQGKDPMANAPAPLTDADAKVYKLPLVSKN